MKRTMTKQLKDEVKYVAEHLEELKAKQQAERQAYFDNPENVERIAQQNSVWAMQSNSMMPERRRADAGAIRRKKAYSVRWIYWIGLLQNRLCERQSGAHSGWFQFDSEH